MNPKYNNSEGFSFIETMVVVAAVGVMAAIAIPVTNELKNAARESKLSSEATSLNTAVKKFVASGGEIKEDNTVLEVLDLLKQELSAEDAITHTGFVGSLVDPRLTGELIDENTPGKRVVWNFEGRRFELTDEMVVGIKAFELDENAEKVTTNRKVATPFKYSPEEGWVWDYGEPGTKLVFAPTDVSTTPENEDPVDPILISLIPPDEITPPDPEDIPDPDDADRLDPPTFSIGGGTYPLAQYRLGLQIENPNTDVPSIVFYRFGGDWKHYTPGETIDVSPDAELDAFVFSFNPSQYASSTLSTATYRSNPVQLDLALNADQTTVGYYDLMNSEVRVRWSVTNLDAIPEYLRSEGFFSTYWTSDASDPAFEPRADGSQYSSEYNGESIVLTPDRWGDSETLQISAYAESQDTTWIHHSEKPTVTINARKESLPTPEISLEEIEAGRFRVTMSVSDEMPPGAQIYYNATGGTMNLDESTGHVSEGTVYTGPFTWEPEQVEENEGSGATGSVNIDRGNGDVPIQQVVLKTNGNLVTQNQTVAFDPMIQPGADTMRGATVNDNSNAEVTIESITINDNGNIIVADNVNVLDLTVSNLNYPNANLNRITAYENGVKLGDANGSDFGQHLEKMLKSRDLRDYIKYDGNNNILQGTPYDFDVTFAPLSNNDYLVVAERFGNSTFDLEALDASGNVISGSNKVVIREYSWNTGYAPSDQGGQPMFLAVIDIEKFGVDTDRNSITGFRVNDDGGADIKFFTISDDSFENRPVHYEGDLTAAVYPPADLNTWFSRSSIASVEVEGDINTPDEGDDGEDEGDDGNNGNGNNGHGNNEDGVDSSNPGQGHGGPNGEEDPSGDVDDESNGSSSSSNGNGNSNNGNGNSNNGNGNSSNGNGNSNNGHGNNEDGVDVSNPGQGNGGPNGEEDPSGEVDDESSPGNGNSSNGNGNGKGNN